LFPYTTLFRSPPRTLRKRPGAAVARGGGDAGEAACEVREAGEEVVEALGRAAPEDGDPHLVCRDRRHVGLRLAPPGHLDEVAPGRHGVVAADAEAARPPACAGRLRRLEPGPEPHPRAE